VQHVSARPYCARGPTWEAFKYTLPLYIHPIFIRKQPLFVRLRPRFMRSLAETHIISTKSLIATSSMRSVFAYIFHPILVLFVPVIVWVVSVMAGGITVGIVHPACIEQRQTSTSTRA